VNNNINGGLKGHQNNNFFESLENKSMPEIDDGEASA
jgi:hypothetical protein